MMNRLLQGDVGSGKTIVAFIWYACFTVDTKVHLWHQQKILANQHFENAINLFKDTNFKVEILTGKTSSKKEKRKYITK